MFVTRMRAGDRTYTIEVVDEKSGPVLRLSQRSSHEAHEQEIVVALEDAQQFLKTLKEAIGQLPQRARKVHSIEEKRKKDPQAYARWTDADDARLELLYAEGKTVKELRGEFGRNRGAIESRIKKLDLENKYPRG